MDGFTRTVTSYIYDKLRSIEVLIRASRLKKIPLEVMAELISEEHIVNAQNESNLSITSNDINIELSNEFLVELRKSAYHGWIDEDVVNHIVKVLEMIDLIYIPGVDSHQLRIPYLKTSEKNETEKDNELSKTKRKCSNTSNSSDEQPYKRICKAEKFEAIKYSLGPNEEYIAIRRCEYDAWERNEDRMSIIYQEIFRMMDEGWMTSIRRPRERNIDEYWWRIYKSGDLEVLES
ncbi:hypothetical protein Tco_0321262 [Tanacetum coccineum]